jgi:hypothetical protein
MPCARACVRARAACVVEAGPGDRNAPLPARHGAALDRHRVRRLEEPPRHPRARGSLHGGRATAGAVHHAPVLGATNRGLIEAPCSSPAGGSQQRCPPRRPDHTTVLSQGVGRTNEAIEALHSGDCLRAVVHYTTAAL